jgi:hypothetical protein
MSTMNPSKGDDSESYYEEEILEEYEEYLEEEDGPGIIRSAAVVNETVSTAPPATSSPDRPMHPMVAALNGGNFEIKPAASRPSHPMVAALNGGNSEVKPSASRPSHPMVAALNSSNGSGMPAPFLPAHPMVAALNVSGNSDTDVSMRPVHPMVAALKGGGGGQEKSAPVPVQNIQPPVPTPVPSSSGVPSRPPHPLFGGGGGGLGDLQSAIRKAATDRNTRVEKEGIKEPIKEVKSKLVLVDGKANGSPQTSTPTPAPAGARFGGDGSASLADQVAMLAAKRNQRRAADVSKSTGASGDETSTVVSDLSFISTKPVIPYETKQQQPVPRSLPSTPEVLPFKSPPFVPKQPVIIPKQQSPPTTASTSPPKPAPAPLVASTSQSTGIVPTPRKETQSTVTIGETKNDSSSKTTTVSAATDIHENQSKTKAPVPADVNGASSGNGGWFGKKSETKSTPASNTAQVSSPKKIIPPKQTVPVAENKSTDFLKISLKPVSTTANTTSNVGNKPEQAVAESAPFGQGMLKPVGASTTTSTTANVKKNGPSNVTTTEAITNVIQDENGVTKTTTTTTTTTTTKVKKITKNDPEYETTEYKFGCLCTIM